MSIDENKGLKLLKKLQLTNISEKYLILLFIFFIAIIFIINVNYFYDDAFISLRYIKHLKEGYGLTWNIGEKVQGYTSFLHIILIYFVDFLVNNLVLSNKIINILYYLILALILFNSSYLKERLGKYFILNNLTILASAPVIIWTLGGLETILFTILTLNAVLIYERNTYKKFELFLMSILLNLAFLTRPEAMIFVFVFIIYLARKTYHFDILFFLNPFILSGFYLLWCVNYYGDFLPNTYYAKSYGIAFFKQIYGFKYLFWYMTKPLFLLPIYLFLKFKLKDKKLELMDSIIILYTIYIVFVGGDHMNSFRFFIPIIPFLTIKIFTYLNKTNLDLKLAYICTLLLTVSQIVFSSLMPYNDKISENGKIVAEFINKNFKMNSTIALNTAGSTPYFADKFKYIDMLGINDKVISRRKIDSPKAKLQYITGHSKGDGKYVLSQKPDYIILGSSLGTKKEALFLSDFELLHSHEFFENYEYKEVNINLNNDKSGIFRYYELKVD